MASPREKEGYQVGIICALAVEKAAMVAMLDETHDKLPKDKTDPNDYTLGRIGEHDVVIACLPAGAMGNGPAATVANNMQRSFSIKFGLMVGIGGGVWSKKADIRLGDVAVSQPTGTHGGVVQWDYGKTEMGGQFRRTGSLNRPPLVLLHALQSLKEFDFTDGIDLTGALSIMYTNKPRMAKIYKYQGAEHDQLFVAGYDHEGDDECEGCDAQSIVPRPAREDPSPEVHYGNIASGNQVMKHGVTRDSIAKKEEVICFEMEAAGLMNDFPCLVIRGICDYADSHKNKRWQPYAAATAAAFARVLLGFVDKQQVMDTPKPPKLHTVLPFGRNKNFIGRQSQLDRLTKIFYKDDTAQECQRAALVGLGGIGKTQIALEFAFRIREVSRKHSVFWVQASDSTSFENSYRKIGKELEISGLEDDNADVKALVKERLCEECAGRWLLIIDNADDSELIYKVDYSTSWSLYDYLPSSFEGGILFTTRDREAATRYAGSNVVDIEEMDDLESRELLKGSLQNQQLLGDKVGTTKLLKLLVKLPLAIMQAAAYLNSKQTTIARYIQIYEESDEDSIQLLSIDFEEQRRYREMKNPIATTWLISFNQIQRQDRLAADYMRFIACIKEQDIPEDLLPPASQFDKTNALGTLKGFGFIKEHLKGSFYDMHRLVHLATRNWLRDEGQLLVWTDKALMRLVDVIPYGGHEGRVVWTAYIVHAIQVTASSDVSDDVEIERIDLLDRVGRCQSSIGQYKTAEGTLRQVLELREEVLGKKHPETLTSMNEVGIALRYQGKYAEAERLHQETLTLREKVLGKEHPGTLTSMNNLALALSFQGKHTEAERLHQETLTLREKVLGKEHPETLISMNNLALALSFQGKYAKAERLHQETLTLREKVLGKEHPETLTSMNEVGVALRYQGKYAEAERLHQETLTLREKVLGKEHPGTLTSMNNLALALRYQGKYAEAERLHQETLTLREKVLGKEHPYTLMSMNNLALALSDQRKHAKAEEMHRIRLQLEDGD